MATQTVRDLIRRAMLRNGILAENENPSAQQANDALSTLNEMMEKWSNERLMIYYNEQQSFTLQPSKSLYTWGNGGDIPLARPVYRIISAYLNVNTDISPFSLPLTIFNDDQWLSINVKETPSTLPCYLYYRPAYPLATIQLWPIPQLANEIVMNYTAQFSTFTSLDQVIDFPPGYTKAMRDCLAAELCIDYGISVSQELVAAGTQAKAALKATNTNVDLMEIDSYAFQNRRQNRFNIIRGS